MWSLALVSLLAFVTKGVSEEIFDVTTIYDVGKLRTQSNSSLELSGRIHTRTNALGLPLSYQPNHSFKDPNFAKFLLTCDFKTCNWDVKQWTFQYYNIKMRKGEEYTVRTGVKIGFESLLYNLYMTNSNYLYLIFTPVQSLIRKIEGKFSMIRIIKDRSYSSVSFLVLKNCNGLNRQKYHYTTINMNVPDYDGILTVVGCDSGYASYSMSLSDELNIISNDGTVQLNLGSSLLLSSQEIRYFSIVGLAEDIFTPLFKYPMYKTTTEGTEMVSPIIAPEVRQLCIVLVLHSPTYVRGALLHILAIDQINTEHFLKAVDNVKVGWSTKHVNITLQSDVLHPIKLVIRKKGSTEVKISYISGCNSDGQEVELLPPMNLLYDEWLGLASKLPAYNIDSSLSGLMNVTKVYNETKHCLNGGELTSAGCACLPGFSGAQCQLGCGRNRFGQDCEGLCSLHSQECEGLLMCTSSAGCRCGPGYKGNYCTEQCLPGWYGNNCSLQCGHCVSGTTCDIYTGRCVSCEPGYVPPYCQQEYVYYALRPEVTSTKYGTLTVLFHLSNVTGQGTPKLYQVQYREMDMAWITYISRFIPSYNLNHELTSEGLDSISETVYGLKDGVRYQVRVLLLVASYNKYEGDRVLISEVVTKCDIPEDYNYNVTTIRNTTLVTFNWNYVNTTVHWCPVETYEVSWKEDWKWLTENSQGAFTLTNLLPGSTVQFKVRAKTSRGYAPYSATLLVSTYYNGTSAVEDLHMVSAQPTSVEIAWQPPIDGNNRILSYRITYKCVEQPACPPGCINASEGELMQTETSLKINQLLPFAQYNISVSPEDGMVTTINVGTIEVVPTEKPRLSSQPVMRTNTSLTVVWDEAPVCSSFLLGYNYQLFKESDSLKVLATGFTRDTAVSFQNLTASTDYIVKVFVSTVAGWNSDSFLTINTSTSATVPEAVRNLTIYKRGRSMLGLRWAKPKATYGELKSFTITYTLGQDDVSRTIEPKPCTVWPDLYCHTLEGLKSNRKYNITVGARNVDVAQDGLGSSVNGITKESIPSAPEGLKLVNNSATSVDLQWNYPNLANGIIRSFFVSVEETDKFDQENCCQVYPLIETPVTDEMEHYETEVSGLQPASTYYVSVSAKTVGLGPSQSLVVYTRPPHLPLTLSALPSQALLDEKFLLLEPLTWMPQQLQPKGNNSDLFTPLIKTRLLLAVTNESLPIQQVLHSGVIDQELDSLLKQVVSKQFFFVAEYSEEELATESEWGKTPSQSPLLEGQKYQLIAAQVTEYSGVYNADIRYSTTITY